MSPENLENNSEQNTNPEESTEDNIPVDAQQSSQGPDRRHHSAEHYRQMREEKSRRVEIERDAVITRNKFIQEGRKAVLRRTNKPLMPSIFTGWRKSLYEGTQSRLETERSDLENMLMGKKAEIDSRKRLNESAIIKQHQEINSLADEIRAYEIEIGTLEEGQLESGQKNPDIVLYKELLKSADKMMEEARKGLETAKIIQEVEAEDLSREQAILEISFGEGINSYLQREAQVKINLFWMTDRRWPSHLQKDKQALGYLGGLVMNKQRASDKKLPHSYYTAFEEKSDAGIPEEEDENQDQESQEEQPEEEAETIVETPEEEAETIVETPEEEIEEEEIEESIDAIKEKLKQSIEVEAIHSDETNTIEAYCFLNKNTGEDYRISVDIIEDLISEEQSIDDLVNEILEFYNYNPENPDNNQEIDVARSVIMEAIIKIKDDLQTEKAKKEVEDASETEEEVIDTETKAQEDETIVETPEDASETEEEVIDTETKAQEDETIVETPEDTSETEEEVIDTETKAQEDEKANAAARSESRKKAEKLAKDAENIAWEKEKSELPYQEGDIIKVRFGDDFRDIEIISISKKEGEILLTFTYGEDNIPWTGSYAQIEIWKNEYDDEQKKEN